MKAVFSLLVLILLGTVYYIDADGNLDFMFAAENSGSETDVTYVRNISSQSIGLWNIQTFGDSKASNAALVAEISSVISLFDVLIMQELRDKDGSALTVLCDSVVGYTCYNSSRAGRSTSKEQYVLFAKSNISSLLIGGFTDWNVLEESSDKWERPPYSFWVSIGGQNVSVWTIHIKPDDALAEMRHLEDTVGFVSQPTLIMGDLNADCSYYDENARGFLDFEWMISNDEDTTVSKTDCTYDRILNKGVFVGEVGILKEGITSKMSDHYPVWISISGS